MPYFKKYYLLSVYFELNKYEYGDLSGNIAITVNLNDKSKEKQSYFYKHLEKISIKNKCLVIIGKRKVRFVFYSSFIDFLIITIDREDKDKGIGGKESLFSHQYLIDSIF
jgi:hypothetical protein